MAELVKKLHLLQAVLTEGECKLTIQKESNDNFVVFMQIGTHRGTMHVSETQMHQIPNKCGMWEKEEVPCVQS